MTAAEALHAARAAPLVSLAALTLGAPILVLAPHPDDESLGCGGLIAAATQAGITVDVALLTDGGGSHPGSRAYSPAALAHLRRHEMHAALRELGVPASRLHPLGWPDGGAPAEGPDFQTAVDQLTALIRRTGARTLLAPWAADPHCDHAAAAAMATAAANTTLARHLAYPVWGWTLPDATPVHAGPAMRLNIAPHLPAKRRAIACHRSQHGGIITDTTGFVLPEALLQACLTSTESFFEQRRA